jgi:hypothetical protein
MVGCATQDARYVNNHLNVDFHKHEEEVYYFEVTQVLCVRSELYDTVTCITSLMLYHCLC